MNPSESQSIIYFSINLFSFQKKKKKLKLYDKQLIELSRCKLKMIGIITRKIHVYLIIYLRKNAPFDRNKTFLAYKKKKIDASNYYKSVLH